MESNLVHIIFIELVVRPASDLIGSNQTWAKDFCLSHHVHRRHKARKIAQAIKNLSKEKKKGDRKKKKNKISNGQTPCMIYTEVEKQQKNAWGNLF